MSEQKVGFLDIVLLLVKGKKFIFFFTLIACIIAVAYSLLATERWASSVTVFPLSDQNVFSMASALMDGLGLGAAASSPFAANNKNSTVLKSRTNTENTIRKFDLIEYFQITERDSLKAMELAIERFHSQVLNILINAETNFMTIRITTTDRHFSRDIAQHYLDVLMNYSIDNANNVGRQKRELLEIRISQITEEMSQLLAEIQEYQIEHNIIEIEQQARVTIDNYGTILEELFRLELDLGYTERYMSNSLRHRELISRREIIIDLLRGLEKDNNSTPFLLPLGDITERYFTIQQKIFNLELHRKILETIYPQLELARLEEIDNMDRIEVIDFPNLAGRRASPLRAFICVVTFLVSLLFSSGCVLMKEFTSEEDKQKIREIWKSLFR